MKFFLRLTRSIASSASRSGTHSVVDKKKTYERGFTFTELVIVIGIVGILLSLAIFNLSRFQSNTSLSSVTEEVIAELKLQQQKAMMGATEGSSDNAAYGIHFDSNQYVLFRGSAYNAADPSNSVFQLDSSVQFTDILIPGGTIVFQKISGEFVGYTAGNNAVTLEHLGSEQQKVITINTYGVISEVE